MSDPDALSQAIRNLGPEAREVARRAALNVFTTLATAPEPMSVGELIEMFRHKQPMWQIMELVSLRDLAEAYTKRRQEVQRELAAARRANGGARTAGSKSGATPKKPGVITDMLDVTQDELAAASARAGEAEAPSDGGVTSEEFMLKLLPLIEAVAEASFDDIVEFIDLDRRVVRYHLNALVKEGRLERTGVGRNSVYASAM